MTSSTFNGKQDAGVDLAVRDRLRAERNILRGMLQSPLTIWPTVCCLSDGHFRDYRKLYSIVRTYLSSHLSDGTDPTLREELLGNIVAEMRLDVPGGDLGCLYEICHESRTIEAVWQLREGRGLTHRELELQVTVSRQCQAVLQRMNGADVPHPQESENSSVLSVPESPVHESEWPELIDLEEPPIDRSAS